MEQTPQTSDAPPRPSADRLTRILRRLVGGILALVVLVGGAFVYAYVSTPPELRHPTQAHYHFRLQIILDGKPVNFAADKFQTDFNKDVCNAVLTKEPFHFHDKLDQFVHVHWDHMTGGLLLKNYGWNLIGGAGGTLGYRFDQLPKVTRIPAHGAALPKIGAGDRYFIYTGDETGYQQRAWDDFIKSDLKKFFAGSAHTSLLDTLIPGAYAHSAAEEELSKLNDVLGSAVIFVQPDAPSDAQVKNRFNHLIALPASVCGG
jgi:hypothetical protein